MEQKVINALKEDIENAEKFFNATGEGIAEAYLCIDNDINKINPDNGTQNIFLYIPEALEDMYTLHLN